MQSTMQTNKILQLIRQRLEDSAFCNNGVLQKWLVINKAQNGDEELLKLLLGDAQLKQAFFRAVDDALVFDSQKFTHFLAMKNFLRDSYTEYKNKIGLSADDEYLKPRGDVVLAWPYKDCVLQGGQAREDDKRNEVFFNQTLARDEITQLLAPKVFSNTKRVGGKTQDVKLRRDADLNAARGLPADTITDNLLIRGNNLLALYSLREQFRGRVKLIYIDPPYNTGGDANIFTYNNNFNHSTWLTFMKNRLEVARELLREDGFIAVAIDHCELFYLGVLADEVFGRENHIAVISIKHHPAGRTNDDFFATTNEYMMVYARNQECAAINNLEMSESTKRSFNKKDDVSAYKLENLMRKGETRNARSIDRPKQFYPIYVSADMQQISVEAKDGFVKVLPVENGTEWIWSFSPDYLRKNINAGNMVAEKRNGGITILYKRRLTDYKGRKPKTTWDGEGEERNFYNATQYGTKLLEKLVGHKNFSYPKSLYTVLDTLKITTDKNDIVLDFFAGSGTTGHAVLALNKEDGGRRQFILVEQLQSHIEVCAERLQKVIANEKLDADYVYCELKSANQNFAEAIQTASSKAELQKVWAQTKQKALLNYNVDVKRLDETADEFAQLELPEQKHILAELLDKNQMYVNRANLRDADRGCTDAEKQFTQDFYGNKK